MSRPKTAGSKEEKAQQAEDLKARKERDAAMGYMYAPCNYCGQAVRWKLPRGMEKTEENLKNGLTINPSTLPPNWTGEEMERDIVTSGLFSREKPG